MINGILIEATGWLGYLQRGEVILQIILMVIFLLLENQIEKRLRRIQTIGVRRIVTPSIALLSGFFLRALGLPGYFLCFLEASGCFGVRWFHSKTLFKKDIQSGP